MNVKTFSIENFNLIVKEIKERIKLCDVLSDYIDDFSDIETNYGKSLVKINNSSFSNNSKIENISTISLCWEIISKYSLASGKEHSSLALNLSQSIVKTLPEHTKMGNRSIQSISQKVK